MPAPIVATLFIDPACPWGYSAGPALRVVEWRYGAAIDWRLTMIGLSESTEAFDRLGYTPHMFAGIWLGFRRYGMPLAIEPKARLAPSARGCRAVIAAGLTSAASGWKALRALQLANFTTPLLLDDDDAISAVTAAATGNAAETIRGLLDSDEVTAVYARQRAEARTAAGTPAEFQGKTATTDEGLVRYTAPSVIFESGGTRQIAGGMQPVEAYDVVIANLDPTIARRPVPDSPMPLFEVFADGLTTAEVAALLTKGNDVPDPTGAERQLLECVTAGKIVRIGMGDDALWTTPAFADEWRAVLEAAAQQPVGA
jgi:2-hydroxychromene-2-carboxylate isomerase